VFIGLSVKRRFKPCFASTDRCRVRARLFDPRVAIVLAMLGGAALSGALEATSASNDVQLFGDWGTTMLSGNWRQTFADPATQAGPLELVLASVARSIGPGNVGFAAVLDVVCMAAFAAVALVLLERRAAGLALAGAAAFLMWIPGQGYLGHPAEILIALLWLLAAREARAGRQALAGALVGLSACFELWGVLGLAVLALAPSLRRALPGALLACCLPLLALLPFVVEGDFHMFDYHWVARSGLARLVLGAGRPFSWQLRVAEGLGVVVIGAAVARLLRSSPESIWLVPAATSLSRIAFDPVLYSYYWNTAQVALSIGLAGVILRHRELAFRLRARIATGPPAAAVADLGLRAGPNGSAGNR
jgi:hypothetical protein